MNRILSPEEQANRDPRLRCLQDRPIVKPFQTDELYPFEKEKGGGPSISEEMARQDPDVWTAAAFVAGRQVGFYDWSKSIKYTYNEKNP